MSLRDVASCGLLCAALLLAGCDEGRKAPGKVAVQIANAAPGFRGLVFQREQDGAPGARPTLSFKASTAFLYDADTYDFHAIEVVESLDTNNPGRVWTFVSTLEENNAYTFVLTEVAGEVQPVVIPAPPLPAAANAQIVALHAANGLPAMDLYLEAPGVGIAGATPRGTFNPQEQIAPFTLPAGDYELFLAAAGNPADVLLTSAQFNLPAGSNSTLVAVAENGQGTAQLSALLMQGSTAVLFDRNAPSELSVINAATDQAPRDLAVNAQFSPPLFSAMPFVEPTAYAPIPAGSVQIQVTPVGNPGVLELDTTLSAVIGQRATMLFTGPAGTLQSIFAADDGRRIHREAKLRFMNAASQFELVDFVVTLPGADPTNVPTAAQVPRPGVSSYLPFPPGDFDLYVYQAGTATLLSGPTPFSVAAEGIYSILSIDGADTATVGLRFLDDFP